MTGMHVPHDNGWVELVAELREKLSAAVNRIEELEKQVRFLQAGLLESAKADVKVKKRNAA